MPERTDCPICEMLDELGLDIPCWKCGEPVRVKRPRVICPDNVPASQKDIQKELLGSFLQRYEWDVFFSGSFSRIAGKPRREYWIRWLVNHLGRLAGQRRPPGTENRWRRPYAFIAHEVGPTTGRDHVHALIGGVKPFPAYCGKRLEPGQWGKNCCALHSWPCGYARARAYKPMLGAAHYLTKYTVKAIGDWAIVGDPIEARRYYFFACQPGAAQ